jgi:bifunctional DNA-binding transcriptional regulator/antitoxin component of YhaV-PrlF toxin-antitoxin module
MAKKVYEVGSDTLPQVIWTLPVEKFKNDNGKDEYIISLPDKVRKHLKLKEGDSLFWGERENNIYEVHKATKDELRDFKVDISQESAIRREKMERNRL